MTVETLGAEFDQGPDAFVDTAAVIANLDLVVTSDTSIAHLAGALGRPVWIALKQVPDWRWMLDREDSPWYPTARLFRQSQRGEWGEVFDRMTAELSMVAVGAGQPFAPTPPDRKPDIAARFGSAFALHQKGKLDEAAPRYEAILEAQPGHFDALHLLGVIRSHQGRHAEALEKIQAALKLQPSNPEALSNLGLVLRRLCRSAEALASYD